MANSRTSRSHPISIVHTGRRWAFCVRVSTATAELGLLQSTFGYTGFGVQWFDYDNDGWLDLFIANGAVSLSESDRTAAAPYAQRKQLFHNEGRGKPLREISRVAGAAFQIEE